MTVLRSLDNDDDFLTLLKLPNFNLEWEQESKAELLDTQTSLKSFKVKISLKPSLFQNPRNQWKVILSKIISYTSSYRQLCCFPNYM